jgi:hypothetical protein
MPHTEKARPFMPMTLSFRNKLFFSLPDNFLTKGSIFSTYWACVKKTGRRRRPEGDTFEVSQVPGTRQARAI